MHRTLRLLAIVALMVMGSTVANGQFFVTGGLDFSFKRSTSATSTLSVDKDGKVLVDKTDDWKTKGPNPFQINVFAGFGYTVNQYLSVGLNLGYGYEEMRTKTYEIANPKLYNETENLYTHYFIGTPFLRSELVKVGSFGFFAQVGLPITYGQATHRHIETDEGKITDKTTPMEKKIGVGVSITPGLSWYITDNLSLNAYLGFISLGYSWERTIEEKVDTKSATTTTTTKVTDDHYFDFGSTYGSSKGFGIGLTYSF